jgi:hypothetical protein
MGKEAEYAGESGPGAVLVDVAVYEPPAVWVKVMV